MATSTETVRRTAQEIFEKVEDNAHDEVRRSTHALAFSGFAGGLSMGLTGVGVASAMAALGNMPGREFIAFMLYPIGFIAVIIGRAQLFTENTLYPVALILSERRHFGDTARLWAVVLVSNLLGAIAFAALAIGTEALRQPMHDTLIQLGVAAVQGTNSHIFWSGVIGGWMIALVAWLVTASHWTIGQLAVIWLLTFVVGIGHFSHCIANTGEIMSAVFAGAVPSTRYLRGWTGGGRQHLRRRDHRYGLNFGQVKAGEGTRLIRQVLIVRGGAMRLKNVLTRFSSGIWCSRNGRRNWRRHRRP